MGLDFFKKFNATFDFADNTINIRENGKEVNINMIDIKASDPDDEKLTESDVKICDDIVIQPRSETIVYVETKEKFLTDPSRHCMSQKNLMKKVFYGRIVLTTF